MRKMVYVLFVGGLTISAMSACKWQSFRYMEAKRRWGVIGEELNKEEPADLGGLAEDDMFAYRYVAVEGEMLQQWERVDRMRNGRMGYLVTKPLVFKNQKG